MAILVKKYLLQRMHRYADATKTSVEHGMDEQLNIYPVPILGSLLEVPGLSPIEQSARVLEGHIHQALKDVHAH